MKNFITALKNKWQTSTLRYVYNAKDDRGRGRLCMLISGIMAGIVGQLSTGFFYTGFLLGHGINIVDIAIITFIPYITCFLNIFSPWILEHFKKRKFILASGKLLYYTVNIVGITLLPELVENPEARLAGFIAIVILSNSINALFSSGYSAWQANFLPDNVRMDYFTSSGCINSMLSYVIVLAVSVITDRLQDSPEQLVMITVLRWIAFGLAIIDCLIQLIPKEYPYLKKAKSKLSNIFVLPFRQKRFLLTILICAAYTFATNLPNATLNAYVLEILDGTGMQYTLPNAINALYFLFFIIFSRMWKKFVAKHYWFRAFAFAMLMQSVTYYIQVFVTANTIWLYVVVRLMQHVFGVVMNSIVASLPYVNLPDEDRTNYMSFHTIVSNMAVFFSMMLGTMFTSLMDDGTKLVYVLGYPLTSTQILIFACAAAQCIVGVMTLSLAKRVTPPEVLKQPAAASSS